MHGSMWSVLTCRTQDGLRYLDDSMDGDKLIFSRYAARQLIQPALPLRLAFFMLTFPLYLAIVIQQGSTHTSSEEISSLWQRPNVYFPAHDRSGLEGNT